MHRKMATTTLQEFIFPDPELSESQELFFRCLCGHADRLVSEQKLSLKAGVRVSTDTFFNSFSISPWLAATSVKSIQLQLDLRGTALIKVQHVSSDRSQNTLQTAKLEDGDWTSDFIELAHLQSGLIFFEVEGLTDAVISKIKFLTSDAPHRECKLGIVITTFNRQSQTIAAVNRLSKSIQSLPPDETERFKIFVIDNGQNLRMESNTVTRVIPNANVGGTGGFMKGLLTLQEDHSFTHCIFMDDDASCFFESVARTKRFLQYSTITKIAVAGTMLLNAPSYMQYEFSAFFRRLCRPRRTGVDARAVQTLLENDLMSKQLALDAPIQDESSASHGYGAWWFFAFALKDIETYSFPFFVRGDDAFFSIHNRLKVIALNGVASWQESFNYKTAPITTYLDCRSTLLQTILLPEQNSIMKLLQCLWLIYFFGLKNIAEYRYVEAEAALTAIADVLKGPSFWFENLQYEKYLKSLNLRLKLTEKTITRPRLKEIESHSGFVSKLFQTATLGGFLLPELFLQTPTLTFAEGSRPTIKDFLLSRSYAVRFDPNQDIFHIYSKKMRFAISLTARTLLIGIRFTTNFFRTQKNYQNVFGQLKNKILWQMLLKGRIC